MFFLIFFAKLLLILDRKPFIAKLSTTQIVCVIKSEVFVLCHAPKLLFGGQLTLDKTQSKGVIKHVYWPKKSTVVLPIMLW